MNIKRKASNYNASIEKYFKANSAEEPSSFDTNSKPSQVSLLETTSSDSIQTDPAGGNNLYEFNKIPIRPKLLNYHKNEKNRSFVNNWYKQYTWLEYSKSLDRAFCHTCPVFGIRNGNFETAYIIDGLNDWTHATVRFTSHERSQIHQASIIRLISRIEQDKKIAQLILRLRLFLLFRLKKIEIIRGS